MLKLAISVTFFCWFRFVNGVKKALGVEVGPTCVALYYHAVVPAHRERFARQMDELVRLSTPVAANCHETLHPQHHYAIVTFDDGIRSVVENAIPELVKRRIPATIFVVADYVGVAPSWESFGPEYDADDRTITLEQIKALPPDLITIGSHTLSHPWLPSLPRDEATEEIVASRRKLMELLERDITLFSFPYGAASERLVDTCREAGYERVFTIVPSLSLREPAEFESGRVAVDPSDWCLEFRLKLRGAYRWLPAAYRLKRMFFPNQFPADSAEAGY